MQWLTGLSVGLLVLIYVVIAPAASQTAVERSPISTPSDVNVLAQQMPDCKEFRNNCVVCVRLSDGELGCSNVGVACTPSGEWRCSVPTKREEQAK